MQSDKKSIAILDANAFISMSNIRNLSANMRLVTTEDVLGELKDLQTKEFVESLPFEIETLSPDQKVLDLVKEFAKKTGDISSLSLIDMELIALAYTLYKKEGFQSKLRKQPPPILERDDLLQIANRADLSSSESDQQLEDTNLAVISETKQANETKQASKQPEESKQAVGVPKPSQDEKVQEKVEQAQQWITVPVKPRRKQTESQSQSDDEEGWITSKNYEKKIAEMTSNFKQQEQDELSCYNIWLVSADFSIQNVAVQMGIKLLSLDGRKITSIRRFVYQCYLCWKKYRIYDEKVRLCNNCGYNSLSKIAYSIDEKGCMILHRKKGWKPNQKINEVKERKFQEQQRKKKHQHARRKKKASIFEN